jgi:hypothetical protein
MSGFIRCCLHTCQLPIQQVAAVRAAALVQSTVRRSGADGPVYQCTRLRQTAMAVSHARRPCFALTSTQHSLDGRGTGDCRDADIVVCNMGMVCTCGTVLSTDNNIEPGLHQGLCG